MYYIVSNPKTLEIESKKPGKSFSGRIARALVKLGTRARVIGAAELKELCSHDVDAHEDVFHLRTCGPELCALLARAEQGGLTIVNSANSLRLGSNKGLSCLHAERHGIPVPPYAVVESKHDHAAIGAFLRTHKEIVSKPVWSHGNGDYVLRLQEGDDIAARTAPYRAEPAINSLLLQGFVPYDRLIRCIVHGGRMLRKAVTYDMPSKSWKCSVCMNPHMRHLVDPPAELIAFAEKIATAFEAQISYVDIFDVGGKYIFNEINVACTLKHHSIVTGVPLARRSAEYLLTIGPRAASEPPFL